MGKIGCTNKNLIELKKNINSQKVLIFRNICYKLGIVGNENKRRRAYEEHQCLSL